jgi:hypothetical protein
MFYLRDHKEVNGVTIKERYGKDFNKAQRAQRMSRYVVVTHNTVLAEFRRFPKAVEFCENLSPALKAAPFLLEAAIMVLDNWEHGNLAAAVRSLQDAVDTARGENDA